MTTLPAPIRHSDTDREIPHFPLYKVLLHNDDVHTMEQVVRSLRQVFQFELRKCEQLMLEAHNTGMALCAIEPLEQAEHHRDQLRSCSLVATIEKE